MDKIVFTLNNKGIHHDYSAMAFVAFEVLLIEKNPETITFMKTIGFSTDDFNALNIRIKNERNDQVRMNEKHLIIFYSVVHFACLAFVDEKIKHILIRYVEQEQGDMNIIREKLLQFGTVVSEKLRREFKHLKNFSAMSEKLAID